MQGYVQAVPWPAGTSARAGTNHFVSQGTDAADEEIIRHAVSAARIIGAKKWQNGYERHALSD